MAQRLFRRLVESSSVREGALDGRTGKARTASMVGAAKSALDGRTGKARTASMVGAAKSAPYFVP